jgi:large subunit ribosomal protein L7/L12
VADSREVSKQEDLKDGFKEMALLELSAFVKAFEEKFAVPPVVPVVAVRGSAIADDDSAASGPEDSDEFDLVLVTAGDRKIRVIKEVRALTGLGLSEAKELVDGAPAVILTVHQGALPKVQAALKAAGATTSVRGRKSPRSAESNTDPGGTSGIRGQTPESTLIREFSAMIGGQALAAKVLDCPAPQVAAWMSGEELPPDHVVFATRSMLEVGLAFSSIWDASLYLDWLVTDNAHLDYSRPIDVIAAGRADDVVNAIEAAVWGIYA